MGTGDAEDKYITPGWKVLSPHPKTPSLCGCDVPQSRQCASQTEESSTAVLIAISLKPALIVE